MTFNEWRKNNKPTLRRAAPVGIVKAGSKRTILGCLCGEEHTFAATWPKPKHAYKFESQHNTSCLPSGVSS